MFCKFWLTFISHRIVEKFVMKFYIITSQCNLNVISAECQDPLLDKSSLLSNTIFYTKCQYFIISEITLSACP